MAIWKITNKHKKSAVEKQFWVKDNVTVVKEEGFRWGTWSCESDEKPNVDLDNPDGYDLMNTDYDWEMEEMIDGCWITYSWCDWTCSLCYRNLLVYCYSYRYCAFDSHWYGNERLNIVLCHL